MGVEVSRSHKAGAAAAAAAGGLPRDTGQRVSLLCSRGACSAQDGGGESLQPERGVVGASRRLGGIGRGDCRQV